LHIRKAVALHIQTTETPALQTTKLSSNGTFQSLIPKIPANIASSSTHEPNFNINVDEEFYPRESEVTLTTTESEKTTRTLPRNAGNHTSKAERECFISTILDPRVREKINMEYGKENLTQCFKAQACLRLVLLPLVRSKFLTETDWHNMEKASAAATVLSNLIAEYRNTDFQPLRGFYTPANGSTSIDRHRVWMATAALLSFDGDMAALVRWIGGTHVGAHRNTTKILQYLKGKIHNDTHTQLSRIFLNGVPQYCNAESTEQNFQAYLQYGNHSSVQEDPERTMGALAKDFNKSYCLLFDTRMVHFTLNCHVTPQGLIGAQKPGKKPRPIFDSSFRPDPWCFAINDWTNKANKPPITFPSAWQDYLIWLYNLRITYPDKEIYPADDDVSGAFRHLKYHPNVVAMHSYRILEFFAVATGTTFGDCSSPSNWDVVAQARAANSHNSFGTRLTQ
jgi:hypothetical protein